MKSKKKLRRAAERKRVRELAKRKRQTHAHNDEAYAVLVEAITAYQKGYAADWERLDEKYSDFLFDTLLVLERMHRTVMGSSLCTGCLEDFKRKKFYTLDEEGYEYCYDALARKRAGLAQHIH